MPTGEKKEIKKVKIYSLKEAYHEKKRVRCHSVKVMKEMPYEAGESILLSKDMTQEQLKCISIIYPEAVKIS